MKFTQLLFKHHLGRLSRKIWQTQRTRSIENTRAEEILSSMGVSMRDASEIADPKKEFPKIEIEHPLNGEAFNDERHPHWKARACLTYKDHNVLQEGVRQACLLTKTIKIEDKLPQRIEDLITDTPEHIDNLVQRIVCTSNIYDAEQVKLPKLKDPNRPAWVFPRVYGITSSRKVRSMSRKFLQLCESLSGPSVAQNRCVVIDGITSFCIDKESDLIQFVLKMDFMTMSLTPLTPIADQSISNEFELPDIHPLHPLIGLQETNIYKTEHLYPVSMMSSWINVHTIFINHDPEEIKNVTELPVTENQIHARSMIKSFAAAAACARQKFGLDVKQLPEPISVQCVQSDAQNFHFSVFQLNTLDIDGTEGIKNFWWSAPSMKLYEKAQYDNGRPTLEGYNTEVFKTFFAFYKNR